MVGDLKFERNLSWVHLSCCRIANALINEWEEDFGSGRITAMRKSRNRSGPPSGGPDYLNAHYIL